MPAGRVESESEGFIHVRVKRSAQFEGRMYRGLRGKRRERSSASSINHLVLLISTQPRFTPDAGVIGTDISHIHSLPSLYPITYVQSKKHGKQRLILHPSPQAPFVLPTVPISCHTHPSHAASPAPPPRHARTPATPSGSQRHAAQTAAYSPAAPPSQDTPPSHPRVSSGGGRKAPRR